MTASSRQYTIERICGHDLESVATLRRHVMQSDLKSNVEDSLRSAWLYSQNPAGPAVIFGLRFGAADWVGMIAIVPRRFWMMNHEFEAGMFCDYYVHPSHRTLLPAIMLQRAAREHQRHRELGTYAIPNSQSIQIFRRLGSGISFSRYRYARPLRYRPFFLRHNHSLLAPVSFLFDWAGFCIDAAAMAIMPNIQLEWLSTFDSRFDELSRRLRSSPIPVGDRSEKFLKWRFCSEPNRRNRILAFVEQHSTELLGYLVGEANSTTFDVRDIVLDRLDYRAPILLRMAAMKIRSLSMDGIAIHVLSEPRLTRALSTAGFRARDHETVFIDQRRLTTFSPWHLTRADEDI